MLLNPIALRGKPRTGELRITILYFWVNMSKHVCCPCLRSVWRQLTTRLQMCGRPRVSGMASISAEFAVPAAKAVRRP